MPDYSIDAIKIAKSIQNYDLSFLRDKEFKMRDKIKKRKRMKARKKNKRVTLAMIANDIASIKQDIKNINARLDYNGLQIQQIEKRLDYNNLKNLPANNK